MFRNKIFRFACPAFVLWFLVAPGLVLGQGRTWVGTSLAKAVEMTNWRVGLLRINAHLEVNHAGYDSDIYYGYLESPVPDYTITTGIPIQVLLPISKTIVIDASDTPQYMFYLSTERERGWNNFFQGRVHIALERFYFQVGGSLSNVRERLSSELDIPVRQKQNRLEGTMLWQASRATSFALLYNGTNYVIGETDLTTTLDRKENYIDFITYIQPNSLVRFSLDAQYGTYVFADTASSFKDSRSFGVFGGINFVPREGEARPIEPVQGSIGLGFKRLDIVDPAFIDGSGFVGAVAISAGLFKRTTGRIAFSRDYEFSFLDNTAYYISTIFGGGITRLLSRRISISYDLSFERGSYPVAESDGGISSSRNVHFTNHELSVYCKAARNLGIRFLGIMGRRELADASQTRNRNFLGLSLIYGNPSRQISSPASAISSPGSAQVR
jgi:hypothetical protein